jgi:starvation-inducible DNA-binding protein
MMPVIYQDGVASVDKYRMEKLLAIMKIAFGTVFASYVKAHASHFNVEGLSFVSLHRLFGDIYQDTWASIDEIGEQIRQLDAYAPGSLERYAELSRIKTSNEVLPAHDMIVALMKDQEIVMATLTEALHAAEMEDKQGLVNFLAGRIESHSKWRWQLRATAKRV